MAVRVLRCKTWGLEVPALLQADVPKDPHAGPEDCPVWGAVATCSSQTPGSGRRRPQVVGGQGYTEGSPGRR